MTVSELFGIGKSKDENQAKKAAVEEKTTETKPVSQNTKAEEKNL